MSDYTDKLEAQRVSRRAVERKRQARISGIKGAAWHKERQGVTQAPEEASLFKRMIKAMDPRLWMSKRNQEAKKRLEADTAAAAKVGLSLEEFRMKKLKALSK
jgi:hypothetical protein